MKIKDILPHKITKPIQLIAVWFLSLLLIETTFFTAAANISEPSWVCPTLVITAICFVPIFLVGIFLMQTVFRNELQEDQYYSEWLRRREQAFSGFKPENINHFQDNKHSGDLEPMRIKRYQDNRGLFLVHSWRPSSKPGQVADIVIWIQQHGQGPLSQNIVEKVEYELGPNFFDQPYPKTNISEQFRLEVSAYGPMLCLARVLLKDSSSPIILERYIDFDEAPNKTLKKNL